MNFAVSVVLAASAILSTIMLQLGDENGDAGLMIAISAFAVVGAVYWVDLKKTFVCSRTTCNVLMLLAVFANVGSLTRSREEFLAFSIANILTLLEAINFYRRKTPRVSYQILTMSFVKVAVGCVFQRSPIFAFLLPLYGACGFCAFSLLFLANERRYYAQNAELSPRFDWRGLRPTPETDAEGWGDEDDSTVPPTDKRAQKRAKRLEKKREKARLRAAAKATRRAKSAPTPAFAVADSPVRFALLTEPARFSSSVGPNAGIGVDSTFFRRFGRASFAALAFAALLFCLFPRFHQLEIGGVKFGSDDWQAGAGGATTGFSPEIELGELGPAVDNPAPALTIRFVDVFNSGRGSSVSPGALVYLRGVALGRYEDRTWSQLRAWPGDRPWNVSDARRDILRRTEIDPDSVLGPKEKDFEKTVELVRSASRFGRNSRTRYARPPFFYFEKATIPTTRAFEELDSLEKMRGVLPSRRVLKEQYSFDSRSQFVGMEIALEPSDAPYLFAVSPFFSGSKSETPFGFLGAEPCRPSDLVGQKTTYRFLTTAFQNGVQAPLTPNQEFTEPLLAEYLELDAERFPRLIELARDWDAESGLPQDDFVGRARFLESRLRDVGDFTYSRTGVARNPELDPLEDFVSEHRSGHCEYFAGALALMLRAVGIPSRTVVGYAFLPKNGDAKTVVRQSDAHSWTEAFVPAGKLPGPNSSAAGLFAGNVPNGLPKGTRDWTKDGAWLRLDATPPARLAEQANSWATVGASWLLFFETIWRDYVLNFNGATQAAKVYRPIVDAWRRTVATLRNFRTEFRPLKAFVEKANEIGDQIKNGDWTPRAVGNFLWFAAQIAVVGYVFWRLFRFFRTRFFGPKRDSGGVRRRRPGAENAFALYRRVEAFLSRRLTVERSANETPREFVERCFALEDETADKIAILGNTDKNGKNETASAPFEPSPPERRRLFREIVERYYRARFGQDALSPEEEARWSAELQSLGSK